jgi:glycosyltransferase involved in cell wall biosynthesis
MNAVSDIPDSGLPWATAIELSVVIPLYNEHEVFGLMHDRLTAVLKNIGIRYELVLVDDGSKDGTSEAMERLARRDPAVTTVYLSRNFGKEAALTAGLAHACGDAVIVMDADMQDPPELIPAMLQAWREGADVVCMRRRSRAGETWFKCFSARHFYRLLNAVSDVDIPADTGDFRLLSRRAVDAMAELTERNRYMKGLFAWIGLPTRCLEYDRAPRAAGASKWDFLGLLNLAFQGITSFSTAPLRLSIGVGMIAAFFGVLYTMWIIIKAIFLGDPVQGFPTLISMIAILGGAQLLSIGVLGEYIGKTYYEAKRRPLYILRKPVRRARAQDLARQHAAAAPTKVEEVDAAFE